MRTASKTFLHDTRGASVPEYGLVIFAVLLVGAVATRTLGGGVERNGDVARRILEGENIRLSGAGNPAPGGGSNGAGGSNDGTSADGTGNGEATGTGGGASGTSAGGSGGSVASAGGSSGGSSGGAGGGSSGDPSVIGGGGVLGASGGSSGSTGGSAGSSGGEAAGGGSSGSTVGSIVGAGVEGEGTGGGVGSDLGGATADSAHGSGSSSSGRSVAPSVASTSAKTIVGALFNAIFGGDESSSQSDGEPGTSGGATSASGGTSKGGGLASTTTRSASTSRGGAVEDKLPASRTVQSATSKTGVLGASNAPKNNVNPPPESETDTRGGTTQTIDGHTFTVSAAGERQMAALAAKAAANAGAKRPKGWCYHQVKVDIQEVGYGDIAKQTANAQLRPLPGSDQGEAHDFADYMNARGANGRTNADNLGLQKLPITNPYDAPKGAIIVVRAGTPGTHNPTAGDIVVAGGNGKFYNDGNMGYGGSKNFKPGNNYVLGIYVPK